MNAAELFLAGGKSAGVFYCGACRIVKLTSDEAERCCQPYKCDMCQKEVKQYYTRCDECRDKAEAQKEAERFDKAEKVTAWDGWVYSEGHGYNEGFFSSLTDFEDYWEGEEEPMPDIKYVWACQGYQFVNANLQDITARICDDAYEDFDWEDLAGLDDLKAALEKFNAANTAKICYRPDYTKAVLLQTQSGVAPVPPPHSKTQATSAES